MWSSAGGADNVDAVEREISKKAEGVLVVSIAIPSKVVSRIEFTKFASSFERGSIYVVDNFDDENRQKNIMLNLSRRQISLYVY